MSVGELGTLLAHLEAVSREVGVRLEPRYRAAVAAFPEKVENWIEFRDAVGLFAHYVAHGDFPGALNAEDRQTGAQIYCDYVWRFAAERFGALNVAYKIYAGGLEGGRREFLNGLFAACLAWQREVTASAYVLPFLRKYEGLDLADRLVLSDAYFARYGHLLPADVTGRERHVRTLDFERLIQKHVSLMDTLRRRGG